MSEKRDTLTYGIFWSVGQKRGDISAKKRSKIQITMPQAPTVYAHMLSQRGISSIAFDESDI